MEHTQVQMDGRTYHVTDRRTELAEIVHRAILRNALGTSYRFELVPMAVPSGDGMEVAYMVALCTASPVPIGSYITVVSRPFSWTADESFVQEIVRTMCEQARTAVSSLLSGGAA